VHRLLAFGRGALGPQRGRLLLSVSVASFVPKPHTPFQWMPQDPIETLERKQRLLQGSLRGRAIKLSWSDPRASALEAAISRGDRRLGRVIEAAWRLGCRFDAWGEQFRFDRWEQAFGEAGLALEDYANARLSFEEPLAWDHIGCGPGRAALRAEAERALAGGAD